MPLFSCDTKTNEHGKEIMSHEAALFPVTCCYNDLQDESVPWHWHDELEAAIITEGQAIVAAGSEKYLIRQGNGFFINAGILHALWNAGSSPLNYHSVIFHPRLVGGSIDSIFWQNYIQPILSNQALNMLVFNNAIPWHQNVNGAIENAWQNCVNETPGYEFQVRAALSQLVFLLSEHCPAYHNHPSEKALRDGARIKKMLQYIHEHYSGELNTAEIAKSISVSPSECLRCFHSTIGTTPIQYVKQYRIQKAVELLNTTSQSITDIGAACGFQEMSYFAKTFREIRGCTPSEYRRALKNDS